jgi:hypothetical protein
MEPSLDILRDEHQNWFSKPIVNDGIQEETYVDFNTNPLNNQSMVLDIAVPDTTPFLINLKKTTLQVHVKITKKDGSDLGASDSVFLVPNAMNSLFSQVEVYMNQTLVNKNVGSLYGYKSYIDNIYCHDKLIKESLLESIGVCEDQINEVSIISPTKYSVYIYIYDIIN